MKKIKLFVACFLLMSVFTSSWAAVSVIMNAPKEVVSGTSFEVEVNINKQDIKGFARFQQELPKGFSVELIDPANSDFKIEGRNIKFLWLIIPLQEEIVIKYRLKTDLDVTGEFIFRGVFSYVDGEKRNVNIQPHKILIVSNSKPKHELENHDVKKITVNKVISSHRQYAKLNEKGEIEIALKINKGNIEPKQFAKVEEIIPKGYQAGAVKTQEADFTFQENIIAFTWSDLPAEQEFEIVYKLVPKKNTRVKKLKVKGSFSYLENGKSNQIVTSSIGGRTVGQIIQEQLDFRKGDWVETEVKVDEYVYSSEAKSSRKLNHKLKSKTGIYFRIQIGVGQNSVNTKEYFSALKDNEPIYVEKIGKSFKYTIGSFKSYQKAKEKCNNVRENTPYKEVFVVAYDDGVRTSIQKAIKKTK